MDGEVIASAEGDENNIVSIRHADGLISSYYHMNKSDILVSKGDKVIAGQQIGIYGGVGPVTGPHLHYELQIDKVDDPSVYAEFTKNPTNRFINPVEFFAKNGITVAG